jgi:hypothetical protein
MTEELSQAPGGFEAVAHGLRDAADPSGIADNVNSFIVRLEFFGKFVVAGHAHGKNNMIYLLFS